MKTEGTVKAMHAATWIPLGILLLLIGLASTTGVALKSAHPLAVGLASAGALAAFALFVFVLKKSR